LSIVGSVPDWALPKWNRVLHLTTMDGLQRAAEMERLMHLLMHDLRSPLGVARGYVSLLGGSELSAEDRIRALRGVTDAIARMSGIVDDVAALLTPDETEGRQGMFEATLLCDRVTADAERRGIQVTSREACSGVKVRVGTSVDRLAESIGIVLSPSDRARRSAVGPLSLGISRTETDLRFRLIHGPDRLQTGELAAVDPETIGTVEQLRAHRHISQLKGQVWREVGETRACSVVLPLSPLQIP
jgi:hypothetical protein